MGMGNYQTQVIVTGLLFLVVFASGFWLSKVGKPYDLVLLPIHKLISLRALVLFSATLY
jgi:hypothetical protein